MTDKITKKDLQEIEKLYQQIGEAIKIIEQETDKSSDKVNKLYKEVAKLNNEQVVKYGQNFSLFSGLATTARDLTSDIMNVKLKNIQNEIRKRRTKAEKELDKQNEAVANLFEDLIEDEIQKYTNSLSRSYDKALKEAKTKKEKQQLGTKEEYINKWGKQFSDEFKKVAETTFDKELNFSENYGSAMTRSTATNIIVDARGQAERSIINAQEDAADKLKDAGSSLYEAGNLLKEILGPFTKIFLGGVDKRSNIYEDTFQGIAVRSNVTRRQYIDTQTGYIPGELSRQGLFNNLEISAIQQSLYDITEKGFKIDLSSAEGQAEAVGRSIDMVLTNKIVPYISASDENLMLLAESQPNLIKQIRGINSIAMDISGNNIAARKHLEEMISELGPVSDLAQEELGVQFAKSIGAYDAMIAEGFQISDIASINNSIKSMVNNPYGAISGGDPFAVRAYAILNQNGGDVRNVADVTQAYLQSLQDYGTTFSGASGNAGALAKSNFSNMGGISYSGFSRVTENPNSINNVINAMQNYNANALNDAAEEITNSFANDEKNTVKQYQTIATENSSFLLDGIKEQFGIIGDSLGTIIKILMTWGLGSLLKNNWSKLLGNGAGEGILASGGGVSLGFLTAAAIPILATAISHGISEREKEIASENASSYSDKYSSFGGDATSAGAIEAYAQTLGNTNDGFWQRVGAVGKAFIQGMNPVDKIKVLAKQGSSDLVGTNKAIWAETANTLNSSDKNAKYMIIGYANAMLQAGNDASIIPKVLGDGITADGVKAMAHYLYNEDGNNFLGNLRTAVYGVDTPIGPNGNVGNYNFSIDDMKKWGTFRQGLAKVPYDEYPALLHSGETIMTASTTATMESMVQAFKDSQNQNYRIDAAIQEQTAQLVSKMNEIINTIGSRVGNYTKTNSSSEKLRDSMYRLTNPMAFEG